MTIEIKSRFNGAVLKTLAADTLSYANLNGADLRHANLNGADLRHANLNGADLRHADLRHANLNYANLSYANLNGADLNGADLSYANLNGANLNDANLNGADLSYANLNGANLNDANLNGADLNGANGKALRWITQVRRSDGYDFILFLCENGEVIRAGCRTFTIAQYRAHINATYPGTPMAAETRDILAFLAKRLKA